MRHAFNILLLPWGEGAPQGWVRGSKPLIKSAPSPSGTPHPSAYAPTFSLKRFEKTREEKESVERAV